jgi:hypothetical protein
MNYFKQLYENTSIADKALTDAEQTELDELNETIDALKSKLYDRVQLYAGVYLTPTQCRRWYLYFLTGSIKAVAETEGVSTAAVSKSLIGTRPNESSTSRIKSPVDKLQDIVKTDVEIQNLLIKIRAASNNINELLKGY